MCVWRRGMGKFDGMLLVSDFDNTLVYTEPFLGGKKSPPVMSARNLEALHYFMAEGGLPQSQRFGAQQHPRYSE